ncbi:MAG TPA: hypothetical protein VGL59_09905 [Polyangia bacterium]
MAVALLGAHASTALHLLLVEHEICPEHGEIVEGTARSASPPAHRLSSTPHLALETGTQLEPHAHDQCLALLGQRDSAWPPAAFSIGVLPNFAAAAYALTDGDDAPHSLRLYRLAPKNSPPV